MVIGIGAALIDMLVDIPSDELLKTLGYAKGSMSLVDAQEHHNILPHIEGFACSIASGGSSANTVNGVANLGAAAGFIGCVGVDEYGRMFKADQEANHISSRLIEREGENTGCAMALISPDSERTFATYLGASTSLKAEYLTPEMFDGYKVLFIEGYLLYNEVLIERAMLLAKRQGLLVALDLASYNIVNEHKDVIKRLVAKYVDIIFANEDEARAYTDLEAEQALEQIVSQCPIAVVKLGVRGSLIARGSERYKIGVIQECISRDKTGAGDLYAAGFLYGLTQGLPLEVCGEIGSILSSYVVEVVGPKMGSKTWAKIREKVSDLQQRQISGAATY